MSSFRVNISQPHEPPSQQASPFRAKPVKKPGRALRIIAVIVAVIGVFALIAGVGAFFYWESLKSTPQYSLALLADAAKNDDNASIDTLIDVDAVVEDFVPQVTGKAIELYGKGLPPKIVGQLAQLALPILPSVKERARAELPRIIRERVESFGNVPFVVMVIGAGRYLDIAVTGDTAVVKSKIPENPLEMKMKRKGDRWQIIGVKDDNLATDIAKAVGQEIINIAKAGGIQKGANKLGVPSLTDLLKKADELIK